MRKFGLQQIVAIIVLVIAIILIGVGAYGMSQRTNEAGLELLRAQRTRAILVTSGEGVVEAMVSAAKKVAVEEAKAEGADMAGIREASAAAEATVRANMEAGVDTEYGMMDTVALEAAAVDLQMALESYAEQEAADREAFAAAKLAAAPAETEEPEIEEAPVADDEAAMSEGDMDDLGMASTEPAVDMTDFVATAEMQALQGEVDKQYQQFAAALQGIYPVLDEGTLGALQGTLTSLIYRSGDDYAKQFDRYAESGSEAISSGRMRANIIRYGDDFIVVGIALVILAALIMFYQKLLAALGLPRLIIGMFFVLLCVVAVLYDLSLNALLSNTVVRMGMNSILVLAMVPGIQCGISLNLGLPIGIVGGLLGGLLSIELGLSGWAGFFFAIAVGIAISSVTGILYGMLLNRLKGSEMAVTTYVGYSVVSLMCIAWMLLPFTSKALRWPMGPGLRVTLTLSSSYKHVLNNFLSFRIGNFMVPTGLLLFMALCCFLMWMFLRSKTGISMSAVGNNPRFAEATGISVDRMRIIGTALSTVLGAVGIIVYNQSYGFMQLYNAPRQMGFIAASAILIGGASTSRARISNVLIGTFLFQGVLTLGMPVANVLVPNSTISETMRILISNGIILYALTKSGGASRA